MITDIDYYIPVGRLSNEKLAAELGRWTPEEIFAKTGIRERCIASPGETAVDMGTQAVDLLLTRHERSRTDFLLFCTQTPDYKLPSSSCLLQAHIGLPKNCGCLDINLACSGFIYGLMVGEALLKTVATQLLLVNSDTYTHYIHPQDAICRPIFGDAAAATLLDNSAPGRIEGFAFGTDGEQGLRMCLPAGGERLREFRGAAALAGTPAEPEFLRMDGPAIYNFTLQVVPKVIKECLDKAHVSAEQVDFFVFHQANAFMLESLRRKIGIPAEKFPIEMADTGNLVSASIPIVLHKMRSDGRIKSGTRTLLCGFGVGLSWGACLITW
ncbi:MAG: ketoacyl-ACP synthase III [bacterium]|nr:ketoacyl-ACP synthase III [bacterium]